MKITPRHWLWFGLGIVVLLSLLRNFVPAGEPVRRLSLLPKDGLGFVSHDLPLNQTEVQVYRQVETVKRLYHARGQRFILTVVDGSGDRHAVHDPLYCFRGDGWQVVRQQTVAVPGGRARLLTLERSGRRTEVVFWFTDGRERYASAWRAWWLSVMHRLTFGKSYGEPVLVLLQPASDETPSWSSVFAQCPFLFEI